MLEADFMTRKDLQPSLAAASIQDRIAQALPLLTAAQVKLANFVQQNPFQSATIGIEDFARANAVSIATANRFARALGFQGYPAFRASLAQDCAPAVSPSERLRQAQAGAPRSHHQLVTAALDADIENLKATRSLLTSKACEQAIEDLLRAQRIFIIGMGTSAHLAGQFEYGLSPYCTHAVSLAQAGGPVSAARRLHDAGPEDLLIAIMFPRYVRDTAELAYLAHGKGARILALTDGPTSPLAAFADTSLYLRTQRDFAANSDAIVLSVIQALCGAVAYHRPHAADTAAHMTQSTQPWLLAADAGQAYPRQTD